MNTLSGLPSATRQAGAPQAILLILIGFLPMMAIISLAPTLPTLMMHFKDTPYASVLVPTLLTAPSACIALLAPVAGIFSDRYGRRTLLLWSLLLYGAGGAMPFFYDDFWVVFGGRLLIGVAEAGILTISTALMADYFDDKPRRSWLTIQGITGSIGASGLIVVAGYLAAKGWQWPFIVYLAAIPLCIGSYFWMYEPARTVVDVVTQSKQTAAPFPYRILALVCFVTMVTCTIYFVEPVHFSLVLKGLGVVDAASIGWVVAIPSIGVPIGAVLFRYTKQVTRQFLLIFLLEGVGLIVIGMSGDYMTAIIGAFLQQMGNGLVFPTLTYWAQNSYDAEHRGRGMGAWASAFFAAQFISPALVAGVTHTLNGTLQTAFAAFGVLSLGCALLPLLRWRSNGSPVPVTPH